MLYILGVLAVLIIINILLLNFSCNGCEKISHTSKTYSYYQQKQSYNSQQQVAFDK